MHTYRNGHYSFPPLVSRIFTHFTFSILKFVYMKLKNPVPILKENTGISVTNIKHLILFQQTMTSFFSITQTYKYKQ